MLDSFEIGVNLPIENRNFADKMAYIPHQSAIEKRRGWGKYLLCLIHSKNPEQSYHRRPQPVPSLIGGR